jgi:acyl-coenzyme A thioesterase 9
MCTRLVQHKMKFPYSSRFIQLIGRHAGSATRTRQRIRPFSSTCAARTDGVFRKLTEMRVPIPWIDALHQRQQQEKEHGNVGGESPEKTPAQAPELVPKLMSDSYVSVTLPLAHDKWLSDTYLNSEGNVR